MAKKTRAGRKTQVILVEANGRVKTPVEVRPRLIEKVKWLPEIEGEDIAIEFIDKNDVPFSGSDWDDGIKEGSSVVGNLKSRTDRKPFEYQAKGFQRRVKRRFANPELIVDGGGRVYGRKNKRSRSKTGRKAAKRTR